MLLTSHLNESLVASSRIVPVTEVYLYVQKHPKYYRPEEELIKLGLKSLNIRVCILEIKDDHIFAGELPILRMEHAMYQYSEFADLLKKMYLDTADLSIDLANGHLVDICTNKLRIATMYYM